MARRVQQPQSLAAPELDGAEPLGVLPPEGLKPDGRHESVAIAGGQYSQSRLCGMTIGPATLNRVVAREARWRDLQMVDSRLTACDLANLDCLGARLRRLEIIDARLTGANFSESRFTDVRLAGCKADAAWFIGTVFQRCRFERCDLRGANFERADLQGVVFRDCDLRQARFSAAKLEGADLRGSNLQGLEAGAGDLRGAIIEPTQAADLIALLGVDLKNRWQED